MTAREWTCVLWDVDGTLVDASEGILARLVEAHEHFGRTPPTRDDLIHWIGPPMHDSFKQLLGMDDAQAADAVRFYRSMNTRDGFTAGARMFPEMLDLMADVHRAGIAQATASSKPEAQVSALMDHFGAATFLAATVGSTPDERTRATKTDVIREALARLQASGADVSRPVLVGDRHHDVEGGAATGVPVVFVTWGFADPSERAGSIAVADSPAELRTILLGA